MNDQRPLRAPLRHPGLCAAGATLAFLLMGAIGCTPEVPEDAGVQDGGPASPSGTCSGKRGTPGEAQRMITSAGQPRSFLTYVPRSVDPNRATPLLLVFHGFGMTAASMRDLTGYEKLADEKGFIVVFGDGDADRTWNIRPQDTEVCGIGELFTNPDANDFQFVDDMLADVEQSHCIDRGHIFATGFSMGGYFSHHLACQRPDLVRAAAPHSSGTYEGPCKGKVPVLMINGTGDLVVDPICARATRDLWALRNGCAKTFKQDAIKHGHCERQEACPARGQVTLCLMDDMCHAWSGRGSGALLCTWDFGAGPDFEDATSLIWRFFEANW